MDKKRKDLQRPPFLFGFLRPYWRVLLASLFILEHHLMCAIVVKSYEVEEEIAEQSCYEEAVLHVLHALQAVAVAAVAVPTQAADVLVVQAVTLLGGRIVCMEKMYYTTVIGQP